MCLVCVSSPPKEKWFKSGDVKLYSWTQNKKKKKLKIDLGIVDYECGSTSDVNKRVSSMLMSSF